MGFIKDWFYKHVFKRELTPKGECFFNYVKNLQNGSDDMIEAYEEDIEMIRNLMEEESGLEFSKKDVLDLLDIYHQEYFEESF